MIERIVNVINAVFKRIGVLMLAIVGVLLIYWVFCARIPNNGSKTAFGA